MVEGGSLISEMSCLAVRGMRVRGVGRRYLHAGISVSRRSQTTVKELRERKYLNLVSWTLGGREHCLLMQWWFVMLMDLA